MTNAPYPKGAIAALITLIVGALCLFLEGVFPWIHAWPTVLTLPISDWISTWLGGILTGIKPAARFLSHLISYPMTWVNQLLASVPWPIAIGIVAALGWRLGGAKLTVMAVVGLGFVLSSGYWYEGMNTLALVALSVPLALFAGMATGLLANEVPKLKGPILTVMDVMQTVPTFAYLTPLLLLFGFGPVVGLIASAIYAAPPMARNVILGLERVDHEIKEAAIMSGGTRQQQLFQVEVPAASAQIMIGVNQCLMAALSMVIIAAVIGGFEDIGWEVLLTMRKAQFGQALIAGLVIVTFAIIIDRMSATLADPSHKPFNAKVSYGILAASIIITVFFWSHLQRAVEADLLRGVAEYLDNSLTWFTTRFGDELAQIKNTVLFYGLLPLRIGLDDAVLQFTWGYDWTPRMSAVFLVVCVALGAIVLWYGHLIAGLIIVIMGGLIETGVTNLAWPFVLVATAALSWVSGGRKLALISTVLLVFILVSGLWDRALLSLYLCGAAVFACVVLGGALGLLSALSPVAWSIIRPICDTLQTIPLFVFLIPFLMVFQIGELSAFLAIVAYAIVPMIRYTRHGLVETPVEMLEAAVASGATSRQILFDIRIPYAVPQILLGLNQTILYAFAMLVIAALVGTNGLGQSIYLALSSADIGMGISAGMAMAILALIADRIVQGFAVKQKQALGL